jgi:sugar/nucleoside kinase (ribokinase family)
MRPRFDVLGLGYVAVDEFLYVDAYPAADAKTRVRRRERAFGGLTGSALVAAARMGARCAYAGTLGTDELSDFAFEVLRREGIDTRHARRERRERPVSSVIVVDDRRHTRNIFFDIEGCRGTGPREIDADLVRSARVLLVDDLGIEGMLRAAMVAREAGVPVVADFDNVSDPLFPQLLDRVDHLILSRTTAEEVTGASDPEEAVRRLAARGTASGSAASRGRELVGVTAGDEGCWYVENGNGRPQLQPAFAVDARDTTGCGDVFHGAYAAALARGLAPRECIRVAAAAAALKAADPSGHAGIPYRDAVDAMMARPQAVKAS